MNDLDKITLEVLEQYKKIVDLRKLYLFEWAEYYNLFKNNSKLGISEEVKSEFLNTLLRDDYLELNEEEKEIFNSMKNSLFTTSRPSRLAKRK